MTRRLALAITFIAASFLPLHARAQARGSDEEARALFHAATVAFDEGRYESALEYFERSYALSRRPELLYNVGVTAERLRRDTRALEAFRRFLVELPNTPQRGAVEARIAILERAVAAQPQNEPRARTEAAPEPEPEPVALAPAEPAAGGQPEPAADLGGPIALAASGGVLVIAGAILVGVAAGDVAAVENAPRGITWAEVEGAYGRSEALSIAGGVGLGVGVALAAGGLIWLAMPGGGSAEHAAVQIAPRLGGIAIRGTF